MAKAKAKTEEKSEGFEEMLANLEKTVGELEREDIPLEEAIRLYERGLGLHKKCAKILTEAKLKIEKLTGNAGDEAAGDPGDEEARDDEEEGTLF